MADNILNEDDVLIHKALDKMRKQYPAMTMPDIQSAIIGIRYFIEVQKENRSMK